MHRSLSFNTRKMLCNQLGENAGQEVADLILLLMRRIDNLERTKVDVTPIINNARQVGVKSLSIES